MRTIALLILSNSFMTLAWYGHLKHKSAPLWAAILASWGIAFFEYCFQVPANRLGYGHFSGYQLKIIQEIITVAVFVIFAWVYLGERLRLNHALALLFVLAAVACAFWGRSAPEPRHAERDVPLAEPLPVKS
ncbi:MAG TPA: hypothetical protein DEB40_00535 [Elusimicrobia bacterium]|nr:hypothetical protein [Elusimicrobiota bacterium]HBT60218.1 hypothetical protein [Elusimicrobiota bacterium]